MTDKINAFVHAGVVMDVGADMPTYPAAMVVKVDPATQKGWTWDGTDAHPPVAWAPSVEELLAYAGLRQDEVLAQVWTFDVAAAGQPAHPVTTRLDGKGQFAMVKVQRWLTLNAGKAGAVLPYSNVDFSATELTPAEADSLVEQADVLETRSFGILNAVSAEIVAGTVATHAQIDAAFAVLAP